MIQSIALNKLVPSPRNVRKSSDPAADAQLKADIAARGLLQNLLVRSARRGKFEVEAGGRRLAALTSLAEEGVLKKNMPVTCLVIEGDEHEMREASLAENFQRLQMNPADEAQAFAAIIEAGACAADVARRFGVTVRFVEGRLRLAALAPCVFESLAAGEITLDIAKAYGATSDIDRQAQVFAEVQDAYYQITADSIRRMVLERSVRGSDPRAILVGRDAYIGAGGRIERELFDDEASESWLDITLLEELAARAMDAAAQAKAGETGLAWVKPTLDCYVSHELVGGLSRLPAEPAPLEAAETARLGELEAAYDIQAAILEDEDSAEDEVMKAESELAIIDKELRALSNRPPILAEELKQDAGAFLILSREGEPMLVPQYYSASEPDNADDGALEPVASESQDAGKPAILSQRLLDELSMQRRDVLALYLASDPALALDLLVFTLADQDSHDWQKAKALTISGPVAHGPVAGFEAKDAPATAALAETSAALDESWRSGDGEVARFLLFRGLTDDARGQWLSHVVARTLVASLAVTGERQNPLHDCLGSMLGIEMAHWWRPTAANYFDRIPKARTLEAFDAVGGPELVSRYAASKKADLAATAERIFSGNFIAEAGVKERALAWVPAVMAFPPLSSAGDSGDCPDAHDASDKEIAEQAA
ncbi:ParB/RepB/Spo0J family partition protein [uncultured Parasphingorhabdus sp.]|uniref:ParB/RepB/Spo0J family partition protein n=1 Tax=uncultured Parasphingorhabdus sp. TaxID=2709694 RepID=UPI0030D89CA3